MSNSTVDLLNKVAQRYTLYSTIFLLIIGTIGNVFLMNIFIILPAFRRNQCAFILTAESVSNIVVMHSNILPYIYKQITGEDLNTISVAGCRIQTLLSLASGTCSIYMVCFASFDQYLSTNPRPSWRQISSLKFSRRIIFSNLCFVSLLNIPFLILTEIKPGVGCTVFNDALRFYLNFFYYPILSAIFPLIVTVALSLLAYRNVRRIVRRQIPLVRRRLDRQLTAMVLARVITFVCLGVPYILYQLYSLNIMITYDNRLAMAIINAVGAFIYSLLYLNFAGNLYLFMIISSRFRRQVKQFLLKRFWHSLKCACHSPDIHRNGNRVAPLSAAGIISEVESV